MDYQADAAGPSTAYGVVYRSEIKVDNRAFLLAALGSWPEVAPAETKPVSVEDFPTQSAVEILTAGYLDLLA
jgi:hypothetical protein